MRKTSRVRALGPASDGLARFRAQLDRTSAYNHAVRGEWLSEAARDFEQLIARIDPGQLTAADRRSLCELLQQLSVLVELGS